MRLMKMRFMKSRTLSTVAAALLTLVALSRAETKVVVAHSDNDTAAAGFRFVNVPAPAKRDAATEAQFAVVEGEPDPNGGGLAALHDGRFPMEEDQPSENFFFKPNTDGGRLVIDLGAVIEVQQVNTYSWHPGARGPQVYKLWASDGSGLGFNSRPKRGTDPEACGWRSVANVDTRPRQEEMGGQYGVSVLSSEGVLGKYRYLLLDISRTEDKDGFGNTFYSGICVIDRNASPAEVLEMASSNVAVERLELEGGKYHITLNTTETPDLTAWAHESLAPVVKEWYPKIVELLPSEGFEAPTNISIVFSQNMRGVAATGGTRIRCAASWFRENLKGEAVGSVVHELVHVAQQYGRARRSASATTPGWVVEGIADYIRWFKYEPQSQGARITKRNIARARYDASYRITAAFLDWVAEKHDKSIFMQLNAAAREGKYSEELWKKFAGKTVQELGEDWKKEMEANAEKEPTQ